MDNNYTPLDTDKIKKKDNDLNTVLLAIVTFTALVLAVMLFILIQKKLRQSQSPLPAVTPSPALKTPTSWPTEIVPTEETIMPVESTVSPTITNQISTEASPTGEITGE